MYIVMQTSYKLGYTGLTIPRWILKVWRHFQLIYVTSTDIRQIWYHGVSMHDDVNITGAW